MTKLVFRSASKLAVSFESDEISFEADRSFKAFPSPIYFDDLRSGEFYDATLEIDGWSLPSFDDADWLPVLETEPPRGATIQNDTDRVVVTKELFAEESVSGKIAELSPSATIDPISVEISKRVFYQPSGAENWYIFKFAENTACVPRLRIVNAQKGQRIVIQAAEYCNGNEISYNGIQRFYPFGFCQRDIYVCRGDDAEEYIPSFTYHGARYLIVIGLDEKQVSSDTLTMLVMNSDIKERGGFECSDEIANALQRNVRISDLAKFVYFPTDCPHREKTGGQEMPLCQLSI